MTAHDPLIAARLAALFRTSDVAHGLVDFARFGDKKPTKNELKEVTRTHDGAASDTDWQKHLNGVMGLGVAPIGSDDTCLWGCIDYDSYDALSHADLVAEVARRMLPLVVARSKSGGAHLFLFLDEPSPASAVRSALERYRVALSLPSKTEIFPKQEHLNGGKPNWLNMPYFGGDESARHGVKPNGLGMTAGEFVRTAEAARVSPSRLANLVASPAAPARSRQRPAASVEALWQQIADAAPLDANNTLNSVAFRLGGIHRDVGTDRNELRDGALDAWRARGKETAEFRATFDRAFEDGIREARPAAGDKQYPVVERMVRITGGEADEFEVHLAGYEKPVTLIAKNLYRYQFFNEACIEQIGVVFDSMKADDWAAAFRSALASAEVRELPRDETIEGQFAEAAQEFLLDRYRSDRMEELHLGKPVHSEDGRIYFRFRDLEERLNQPGSPFRSFSRRKIGELLQGLGRKDVDWGPETSKMIKGRKLHVRWVRAGLFDTLETIDTRPVPREPV